MSRWDDAEEALRRAQQLRDAQERQRLADESQAERLRQAPLVYVEAINASVQYYIDTMWTYRSDVLNAAIRRLSRSSGVLNYEQFETLAGPVKMGEVRGCAAVSWEVAFRVGTAFVVQSDGRWYFVNMITSSYSNDHLTPDPFGYGRDGQLVLGGGGLRADDPVPTLARTCLAALLVHYNLPLPS